MSSKMKIEITKSSVYLHIEDLSECCFELWDVDGEKESAVKVKIPLKEWKTIVKHWKNRKKDKK